MKQVRNANQEKGKHFAVIKNEFKENYIHKSNLWCFTFTRIQFAFSSISINWNEEKDEKKYEMEILTYGKNR